MTQKANATFEGRKEETTVPLTETPTTDTLELTEIPVVDALAVGTITEPAVDTNAETGEPLIEAPVVEMTSSDETKDDSVG